MFFAIFPSKSLSVNLTVLLALFACLAAGKTLPEAICFTAGTLLLSNHPTCDQTADRRQVKSN